MLLFLVAGIIPAILLVEFGRSWYPIQDKPESFPAWAGFLSLGLGLLLGIVLLAFTVFRESGSWLVLVLLPAICALFAESCLYLFVILGSLFSRQAVPFVRWPAASLLLIPFLFVALGRFGDKSILQVVLFGGAVLASGWLVWKRLGRSLVYSYLVLLLLLLIAVWATDTASEFLFLPADLASIFRSLVWLAPGLGIILSFRLLSGILTDEQGSRLHRLVLGGLLIFPIFLLLVWQAATASAWDVATDGLGGIFMLELTFVFGVATAIHQSWSLSLKRNSFVFGFAVLTLVIIMGANSFGIFGFDGAWGNVPHARTYRRAGTINRAILRYYEERGQYPQALADLTPVYLLYLPSPFIIPHQDWCYQGARDYYRLGYVYRDYFSTPASVKVFAAVGQPSNPSWACDAEATKYPAPTDYHNP